MFTVKGWMMLFVANSESVFVYFTGSDDVVPIG